MAGTLKLYFDANGCPATTTDVTSLVYGGAEAPASSGEGGGSPGITGETIRFSKSTNQRWSCSFTLIDSSGTGANRPAVGQAFRLLEDGNLRFSGFIDQVEEAQWEGTNVNLYACTCSSWTSLLDRRVVTKTYQQNTPAGNVIADIIATLAESITVNHVVAAGALTAPIALEPILASAALDTIRDMINEEWWVDESKDLHFSAVGSGPTLGFSIDNTGKEWVAGSMKVTRTTKDYRNVQYVSSSALGQPPPNTQTANPPGASGGGAQQYTLLTDTYVAGTAYDFFVLTSQPIQLDPSNPINPTVKVNGASQTIKQYFDPVHPFGDKTVDAWYWTPNSIGMQHSYFGSQKAPNPGDKIEITYQAFAGGGGVVAVSAGGGSNASPAVSPATKNWVVQTNATEIAARAAFEGDSGRWENATSVPGISDSSVAGALAAGLLARSDTIPTIITFDTWRPDYVVGSQIAVNINYHGVNATFTVQQVDAHELYDQQRPLSVKTNWGNNVPIGAFIYTVTLSNQQNIGNYVKWFEGLIRSIGAGGAASGATTIPSVAGGTPGLQVIREIPSGTIDGVNTTFTLSFKPAPPWALWLYVNGVLQHANALEQGGSPDYTLSGNVITLTVAPRTGGCPATTDMIEAIYLIGNVGLAPQQVNTTVYGTGAFQNDGQVDAHWTQTGADTANPGPAAFVVNHPYPAGFVTDPTANWIGTEKNFASPAGSYKYTMLFQWTATTGTLKGKISADDTYTMKLNGTVIQSGPPTMYGQSFDNFNITSGFIAGTNTLEIDVTEDGIGASGILVVITQATSP